MPTSSISKNIFYYNTSQYVHTYSMHTYSMYTHDYKTLSIIFNNVSQILFSLAIDTSPIIIGCINPALKSSTVLAV